MDILDGIFVSVISSCVAFGALKGLNKLLSMTLSLAVALLVAKLTGRIFGKFLLSKVINLNISSLSFGVSFALTTLIGTIVVFLQLFFMLRLIFKIVDGKMEKDLYSLVLDRLNGALAGFFIGVSVVFSFTELVFAVLAIITLAKNDIHTADRADRSVIFKLARNLN